MVWRTAVGSEQRFSLAGTSRPVSSSCQAYPTTKTPQPDRVTGSAWSASKATILRYATPARVSEPIPATNAVLTKQAAGTRDDLWKRAAADRDLRGSPPSAPVIDRQTGAEIAAADIKTDPKLRRTE